MLNLVQKKLGSNFRAKGSISHINRVTQELVSELRSLTEIQQAVYLKYLLIPAEHSAIGAFIQACIQGDGEPSTWSVGRLVAVSPHSKAILSKHIVDILVDTVHVTTKKIVRICPEQKSHVGFMAGAPVVLVKDVDHHWTPSAELFEMGWDDYITEPIDDPILMGRRWLTTWIHFRRITLKIPRIVPADRLLELLYPEETITSQDMLMAASAYHKLAIGLGDLNHAVGELGPDSFYLDGAAGLKD